jgi:predicted site-specific integrase-resolvase
MYSISEFAKRVGVTVFTVQRWDREGKLIAKRMHTGRRYYTEEDIIKVLGKPSEEIGRSVAYCRVSSPAQKPDLLNQREILQQFCDEQGIVVDEWIEEVGGGLNLRRKKFLRLVDGILSGEIKQVVVAHRDRLARFGFDLMTYLCERMGCQLIVMDNPTLSPEQEMVQDLMTIVHTFSSRLYGLRKYKKALRKALADDTVASDQAQS